MVYLIGYDLNKSGKDYEGLYDAIKSYGTWCHPLDSTWLIETNSSESDISAVLKAHVDDNDALLIIKVTKNYIGWLTTDIWDWMKARTY